jgi:hypothetical protein
MNANKQQSQGTNRRNARWAGVFYILATAAPILAYLFIRFLETGASGDPPPDYLVQMAANGVQVSIGMLLELTYALAVLGIISTLFPILRQQDEALVLGFSGLRFMEIIGAMVHALLLLLLLTLSQEYATTRMPDDSYLQTTGSLILAAREWVFLIGSGLVWSLSALILNYLLLKGKLIPRWLSAWGLAGAALSLVAYLAGLFSADVNEFLYLPIGIQEMVFAVWLILRGIDSDGFERSPKDSSIKEGKITK